MKRIVLIILALSVVVNAGWAMFVLHYLRTDNIKTTATVTDINNCLGTYRRGSMGNHCPVFTYRDYRGKSHEVASTEGFNEFNKPLLGVKVGDTKTAWYEKSKPNESYILYGLGMLSVWVLPLIIGLIVCVIMLAWRIIGNKKANGHRGVRHATTS